LVKRGDPCLTPMTAVNAARFCDPRDVLNCRCGRVWGPRRTLGWGCAAKPGTIRVAYAGAVHLGLIAIVVSDYDPAISFFVDLMGFELVEDSPSLTNDGRPKRWVVVRPPGAVTGLLLARADGEDQAAVVGRQAASRAGFFLHVEDFGAVYARMASAGVQFVEAPRTAPYGRVAVFPDVAGNKWDLIGPATQDRQLASAIRQGRSHPVIKAARRNPVPGKVTLICRNSGAFVA
jgi:catechol 2,3-dioxygenase-like lactoylglutathione lyase family enzyme